MSGFYSPDSRQSATSTTEYYASVLGSSLPVLSALSLPELLSLRDGLKRQYEASFVLQSYTGAVLIKALPTQEDAIAALRSYAESGDAVQCYRSGGQTDWYARIVPDGSEYRLSIHREDAGSNRTYHHCQSTERRYRTALESLEALVSWSETVSYPAPCLSVTIEPNVPRIVTTFDIVTPESAEQGDYAESGWEDENGYLCVPDETDTKEDADGNEVPMTPADLAVRFLTDHYVSEPSSSPFSPGTWYSASPDQDYSTGEEKTLSYHLHGFTPEQEQEIYSALFPRRQA